MLDTVTIDTIIEKAVDRLPENIVLTREESMEYAWEAMQKIPSLKHMDEKLIYLEVQNRMTEVPRYIDHINNVYFVTSTVDTNEEDLETCSRTPMLKASAITDVSRTDYSYNIDRHYLHTDFDKGIIELSVKVLAVDDNYEPLIPKNVNYIEAVTWYIVKSILWKKHYASPQLTTSFQYADKEWGYYSDKVGVEDRILTEDGYDFITNKYMRILPTKLRSNRVNKTDNYADNSKYF